MRQKMMLVLFWRMLRSRVAVMLWMFMLLGTGLSQSRLEYVWAGLVLACCYVTATCFNDVADQAVDRINHPRDNGRPLVSGDASPRQLLVLGSVSAVLAVLFAVPLGWPGLVLAVVSLLVGHGYSLRPARISYRAWYLAAPVLSIGYVVVPFLLGVFASGRTVSWHDVGFCAGLYLLFVARINHRRPHRRLRPELRHSGQPPGPGPDRLQGLRRHLLLIVIAHGQHDRVVV